jgi:hypothetical protein
VAVAAAAGAVVAGAAVVARAAMVAGAAAAGAAVAGAPRAGGGVGGPARWPKNGGWVGGVMGIGDTKMRDSSGVRAGDCGLFVMYGHRDVSHDVKHFGIDSLNPPQVRQSFAHWSSRHSACAGQLRFRCALLAQRLRSSYHPSLLLPLAVQVPTDVRAMLLAALLAPLPRRHAVILRPVLHRLPPRLVPLRSLRRVPCAAYPAPRPPRRVPCAASLSCRLSSPADALAARPVLCCLSPLLPCCPSARRCRCPSPPPRHHATAHRHHRHGYSKIF